MYNTTGEYTHVRSSDPSTPPAHSDRGTRTDQPLAHFITTDLHAARRGTVRAHNNNNNNTRAVLVTGECCGLICAAHSTLTPTTRVSGDHTADSVHVHGAQ